MIENGTKVTFLYRGTGSAVGVPGDANGWSVAADPMQNLGGTDLWYLTKVFEQDARLDYKFYVGGQYLFDPMNPNISSSGFGGNSELRMPGFVTPVETVFDPSIAHGALNPLTVTSTVLGNSRTVQVYLPPSYDPNGTTGYPLVLFHDGLEFISLAQANNTLDSLIHSHSIREVIGVFVPPVNRQAEYIGSQQDLFVQFIGQELLPSIRSQYRVSPGADQCATVGISNGGDISQYLGLKLSSVFGNIGCFSAAGAFPQSLNGYSASPMLGQKFYMDAGTYDAPGFLEGTATFVNTVLVAKGYNYQFNVYHQGHAWGSWKAHLANALKFFFPY